MRENSLLRILPFMAVGLLFATGISTVSSKEDMPSIYFYSRDDKAFIAERADGLERRVLVSYVLKEGYKGEQGIFGGGWSPSGHWFTWMSRPVGGEPAYSSDAYLLDYTASSTEMIVADEQVGGFRYSEWSPIEDLLLVVTYDYSDAIAASAQVYDPASGHTLFHVSEADFPKNLGQIHWSPDGQSLAVSSHSPERIIPISRADGATQAKVVSVYGIMAVLDGSLMNLMTHEITPFSSATRFGPVDAVRWHPSGQWFFMASLVNEQYEIRLVDATGHVSTDAPLCPLDSSACYGWMPDT